MHDILTKGEASACTQATGVTQLAYILNTHHHQDHVGANVTLKERHGCTIVGPKADRARECQHHAHARGCVQLQRAPRALHVSAEC